MLYRWMFANTQSPFVLVWMAFVAATSGCGKDTSSDNVAVFPVQGRVLYNGQPLADARMFLHPSEPDPSFPRPRARTDADGRFTVTTYLLDDGAPAGGYRVTISCKGAYEGKSEDRDEEAKERMPAVYLDPATTPITVEVPAAHTDLGDLNIRGPAM